MWELWVLEQADVPKLRPSTARVCHLCEAFSGKRAAKPQSLVLSGGQNIAGILH